MIEPSNLGPSPASALARDAQALTRPVSDSLSELPNPPSSPKNVYTTAAAIKIVQFCM